MTSQRTAPASSTPFSLSTAWNSPRHRTGASIVREIREAGFDTIELGFALTQRIVEDILKIAGRGEIRISSLHHMCPLPPEIPPTKASPDTYSIASNDETERRRAVELVRTTLSFAKRFSAPAVVLHAGRIEMADTTRELAAIASDSARFSEMRSAMIDERRARKGRHVENVIRSLAEIVPTAEGLGVKLALETRYHYREIPMLDEFGEIFSRFARGTLWYWHDAGHAEAFERMGFSRHADFLERYGDRLLGVHLHDIIGPIDDHKAPSFGTLDFSVMRPFIKTDTIKVIEAHQPASSEQLARGVAYLRKVLL